MAELPRLALVLNPRRVQGDRAAIWTATDQALRARAEIVARLETRGDGTDVRRITEVVEASGAEVFAAAGGDGTVNDALAGVLASRRRGVALAILPLGTGNNVARSFGLQSLRLGGDAVRLAVAAAVAGQRREVDAGVVNDRPFLGSFGVGMDAEILARRNRLRRRLRSSGEAGGYALYLWSCAACLLSRRGGRMRLVADGVEERLRVYNVNVVNAPIYAGEFRFDAENTCDDGRLEVHVTASAVDYVGEYRHAWRRHVRFSRGEAVEACPTLRRVRELTIEAAQPIPAQIDGEELGPAGAYRVRVLPRALLFAAPGAALERGAQHRF